MSVTQATPGRVRLTDPQTVAFLRQSLHTFVDHVHQTRERASAS